MMVLSIASSRNFLSSARRDLLQRRIVSPMQPWSSSSSGTTDKEGASLLPPPSVTLYQYSICPFCSKTKAFLGYVSQDYTSIEVNPLTKSELKQLQNKSYRKVPIAQIDGVQVNGSDEIIEQLLNHPSIVTTLQKLRWASNNNINNNNSMTMKVFTSSKWSAFANEELAPILYPNICSTLSDSYRAFSYVETVPTFSFLQKQLIKSMGSVAMYLAASNIKKKRGITNEREALYNALIKFETEGLCHNPNSFSSGLLDIPDIGDITMYGVLKSVEGLPVHDEVIYQREGGNSVLKSWYERMKNQTS